MSFGSIAIICVIILIVTHAVDDIMEILKFNKKSMILLLLLVLISKNWVVAFGEWKISIGGAMIPFFIFIYCLLQTRAKTMLYTVFITSIAAVGGYLLMGLFSYSSSNIFNTIAVAFFSSVICLVFGKGRISILTPSLICAQLIEILKGLEGMWSGMTLMIGLGIQTNFDLAVLCMLLTVLLNYCYIKIFHQQFFIKRKQYKQWRS